MSPSIFNNFKQMRRRSRASFRTERSADTSSDGSQGTTPTNGSVTPPSIAQESDPALNLQLKENLASNDSQTRTQPTLQTYPNSNRHSVSGMTGLGSPVYGGRGPSLPVSQYAPRLSNITENSWVYQKVLLVYGTIADPSQCLDGTVTVSRLDDAFPAMVWPVCASQFKALVYLMPGANRLRFEFSSPKLANSNSPNPIHASYMTVHMMPPTSSPPLQLAIVVAADSPCVFEASPARREHEGNGIDVAARKLRAAAYLWQAFTAEQMWRATRQGLSGPGGGGRRVFRFDEEWTTGTAALRDREMGTLRSEARVLVVRSDRTVRELEVMTEAQRFDAAADALRRHLNPLSGQKHYVSAVLLDVPCARAGLTATPVPPLSPLSFPLGGSEDSGQLHLAVFGAQAMQAYPSCLDEVVPALTDCTPTADAASASSSSWEVASAALAAQLREVGRMFGCVERDSGIMVAANGAFPTSNPAPILISRAFLTREAYSTRTRSKGGPVSVAHGNGANGMITAAAGTVSNGPASAAGNAPVTDESGNASWHRLDCLRFRSHPCFRLPNDPPLLFGPGADDGVQAWPVEGGVVVVTAPAGIAYLEIYEGNGGTGEDWGACKAWIEYPPGEKTGSGSPSTASGEIGGGSPGGSNNGNGGGGGGSVQRHVALTEATLRERIANSESTRKVSGRLSMGIGGGAAGSKLLRVVARSHGGGELVIDDFRALAARENAAVKGVGSKTGYRSKALGSGRSLESLQDLVFTSAVKQNRVLSRVVAYYNDAVTPTIGSRYGRTSLRGVEFVYDDDSRQLLGLNGEKEGDAFDLDIRRGEYLTGFVIRAGGSIHGIQLLSSIGRRSAFFGDAHSGSSHTLIPPRGYTICGISGSCSSSSIDTFSAIIAR